MRSLKFLLTDYCNLRCSFCHNEFQGDTKHKLHDPYPYFNQETIVNILERHHAEISTLKLSGGEPLLNVGQCKIILKLSSSFSTIQNKILISNMTLGNQRIVNELIESGLTEIRVNVPSMNASQYSQITGKDKLQKVIGNSKYASFSCHVRFQKVTNYPAESISELIRYISSVIDLGCANTVSILIDQRSESPIKSFDLLSEELLKFGRLIYSGRRHRFFEYSGINVQLTHCSNWDPLLDSEEETDIYIVPPGLYMKQHIIGRAYLPAERNHQRIEK